MVTRFLVVDRPFHVPIFCFLGADVFTIAVDVDGWCTERWLEFFRGSNGALMAAKNSLDTGELLTLLRRRIIGETGILLFGFFISVNSSMYKLSENPVFRRPVLLDTLTVTFLSVINKPASSNIVDVASFCDGIKSDNDFVLAPSDSSVAVGEHCGSLVA